MTAEFMRPETGEPAEIFDGGQCQNIDQPATAQIKLGDERFFGRDAGNLGRGVWPHNLFARELTHAASVIGLFLSDSMGQAD